MKNSKMYRYLKCVITYMFLNIQLSLVQTLSRIPYQTLSKIPYQTLSKIPNQTPVYEICEREFLSGVNLIWKNLAKKVSRDVLDSPHHHSLMYVPNGFFVNMETQNDFGYWDTYWMIKGALICGMEQTVKGILENLLFMVKEHGYVLSRNRVYYKRRSEPPLLIQMMAIYQTYTNDTQFLIDNVQVLDQEMTFWLTQRSINVTSIGNMYSMTHYSYDTFNPRPESYADDVNISKQLKKKEDQDKYISRVKAAFESGWGFSSKHFHDRTPYDDLNKTMLKTNPLDFTYVELNSIMQSNANVLSKMYLFINDTIKSEFYKQIAHRFQIGINALLWNEEEKMWLDFDNLSGKSRNYFYASNLAPLWTGSYDEKLSKFYGDAAVDYLIRNQIINDDLVPRYICIPTSLYDSNLEWDYYNCWPQLQSMVIFGLQSTKSERAKKVAFNFANMWVYTNYVGYMQTRTLFQKYSAIKLGDDGNTTSSENRPKGYGVTVGLLFEIFHKWGHLLMTKNDEKKSKL
ncbi:trehalase-like isoform X2 [Sipha flava]|uniref:Trehalase n=1 Tax=Sipha flava TaxID=143950 RepID=A0A8B8FGT8_9HEMI|nr:trehalase-like isoform X2 [Sipha flava]